MLIHLNLVFNILNYFCNLLFFNPSIDYFFGICAFIDCGSCSLQANHTEDLNWNMATWTLILLCSLRHSPSIFVWRRQSSVIDWRRTTTTLWILGFNVTSLTIHLPSDIIRAGLADQGPHWGTHHPPPFSCPCGTWYLLIAPPVYQSESRVVPELASVIMLACCWCAEQSAIAAGCRRVKHIALLVNVLVWHYSGLYPPPFRLAFHTGRACAAGITLNKQLDELVLCESFYYLCQYKQNDKITNTERCRSK